jgi:hypothetical protein
VSKQTSRWRRGLDEWFGTVARWAGLGLLLYSLLIDRLRNPALLPTATGLIFLKNVAPNGGGDGKSE